MARIIGGIAASHTPTIGFAYDRNKRDDRVALIFENFAPLSAWLAEKRPTSCCGSTTITSSFFRPLLMSCLGWGPSGLSRTKVAAHAICHRSGPPTARFRTSAIADGRRVRHVVLPESGTDHAASRRCPYFARTNWIGQ